MKLVGWCDTLEELEPCLGELGQTPSRMEQGFNLHFFRKDSRDRKPCWERFSKGGSWTFSLPLERSDAVDKTWRQLVRAIPHLPPPFLALH